MAFHGQDDATISRDLLLYKLFAIISEKVMVAGHTYAVDLALIKAKQSEFSRMNFYQSQKHRVFYFWYTPV